MTIQQRQTLISQLPGFYIFTATIPSLEEIIHGTPSVARLLLQSKVDSSESDSTTYRYLHTSADAIESFGVHSTHPSGRDVHFLTHARI